MVAVVDYGMGNLRSVANALEAAGAEARVTASADDVNRASHIVLPGVGAFRACIDGLRATGLIDALDDAVRRRGAPFLGICVGMQLLAEDSDEGGRVTGLGWIPGHVRRFDERLAGRVPHMGWNDVEPEDGAAMFRGIRHPTFFFVHSYFLPADGQPALAGRCEYGGTFAAAIASGNMWATQFHPEKSQQNGLRLLQNFLDQ